VLAAPATGTDIAFTDSGAVMPGAGCLQNGPTGATCHRPAYPSASLLMTLDGGNDSGSNGTALPATIDGGAGNDTLTGGIGNDTLTGGLGTDTADYSTAPSAVTVDLSNSSPQNTQGAGTDTLSSLENVIGSAQGDTLTGSAAQNSVSGG